MICYNHLLLQAAWEHLDERYATALLHASQQKEASIGRFGTLSWIFLPDVCFLRENYVASYEQAL